MKRGYSVVRICSLIFLTFELLYSVVLIRNFIVFLTPQKVISTVVFEFVVVTVPLLIIFYNLAKDRKFGWILGVIASVIWLALTSIVPKILVEFQVISLPLYIIGFTAYQEAPPVKKTKASGKQRGGLLTIVLFLSTFINFLDLYLFTRPTFLLADKTHYLYPFWFQIVLVVVRLAILATLAGIWGWKKYAVFAGIFLSVVYAIFIEIFYSTYEINFQPLANLVVSIIGILVLNYPIYRKWKYFK